MTILIVFDTRREIWLPQLPLQARPIYSSEYHDKKRPLSIFFNSSQQVKPRRCIPFSLYFALIRDNYNIGELQIQGEQSISY